MASAESEPITGFLGRSLQQGLWAEPLVRLSVASSPEAESFLVVRPVLFVTAVSSVDRANVTSCSPFIETTV